ncbi:MAG TPA: zinc metallopeptidase [Candidatus Hydrogenedentes bacterium]|nr:zinc metallopeptidase [Candidatus Hydrogenedentota bacterium]
MPGFYMFHPADLLMIPAIILTVWAQAKVRGAYSKYSQVFVQRGITGAQVAQLILRSANIGIANGPARGAANAVALERIGGQMTDHYDPQSRTLRLSEDVYNGRSIAALGIAAHETGHALQHADNYVPMQVRHFMYPISALGSRLAFPLIFIGLIIGYAGQGVPWLVTAGIWLFTASVAFTIITLPVEFNASRRAMQALSSGGYLTADELYGARKVLTAAAMTYVAAAAVAVLQLVRLLIIFGRRD